MGTLKIAGDPPPQERERFRTMLCTLSYNGPVLHLHVLGAQQEGDVLVLVWPDASEATETEVPTFSAKGTVNQTFGALKQWLTSEGWIRA